MKKKDPKKRSKKINTPDKMTLLFAVLFSLTPVIISVLLMTIKWISQGFVALPSVKWNDEAAYIKLIETYSRYISPKGYWGFDSNHALIGTGSAWSAAILAPYVLPALIFPVEYSFVYVCNLIYMVLANVAFSFLVKPDKKKYIKLILAQVTSVVFVLYINTNMSELFRYALAVLIAGMLYKMFFDKCPGWLKYAVIPITIVYAVQVYTFFAFCIPLYVFALLKEKKLIYRILIAIAAGGFITFVSYGILHLISSNYNIGKTESLLNAISTGQIFAAVKSFFSMVLDGVRGLLNLRYYITTNGVYIFHVMIILLIIVSGCLTFFSKTSAKKDKTIALIAIYSTALFVFMYMTLYTIVPDTFLRGTFIPVIFSVYLFMMTEDKFLAWTILVCNVTGLFFLPVNLKNFQSTERYYTKEEINEWKIMKTDLSEVMILDGEGTEWDNTVVMYTMEPKVILAVPKGFGQYYVLHNDYYGSDSGYILVSKISHVREDWIEQDYSALMIENSAAIEYYYDVIYDKNGYIVYRRKDLSAAGIDE